MSIMAKTPSGYKKIGSAYLGERPVDKVFNANGDVVYALQRELTGVPPLLFKGKEQSELLNYRIYGNTETKQRDYSGSSPLTVPVYDGELYNYRIYGNTVNGESVGDRTGNLFDEIYPNIRGNPVTFRAIYVGTGIFTLSGDIPIFFDTANLFLLSGNVSSGASSPVNGVGYGAPRSAESIDGYITIGYRNYYDVDPRDYNIMLNAGSTALPYEPYGYKVPITVTNSGTTSNETIYLPEPIKMVGSEAEYVDYYSQKQYFADGTNTAITVPALPISTGTNTVTVNTTVQPSSVEVSTDENVSVGDLVTSGQHAGEYKVDVTVEGKNLFDENAVEENKSIYNGGISNSTASNLSGYIPIQNNSTYILSWAAITLASKNQRQVAIYNAQKEYLNSIQFSVFNYNTGIILSSAEIGIYVTNAAYIRVVVDQQMTNIMLIEGSTPIPYEPYHAPVTTPIYLPEPIKMVGDEAEYIDYGEQKMHRVRKNLFDDSTITPDCYVDDEGRIIGNDGIDTSDFIKVSPNTNYTYKGAVIYDANIIRIAYYDQSKNFISRYFTPGNAVDGETVTTPSNCEYVKLSYDKVITNLMLNSGSTSLPYEPYIENTDLDVTLPALPTIKGTNTMSVDTEVQPSRMDIKGRIKSLT